MPYFLIEDFRGGLDYRRLASASPPGTLRTLRNAVINRGGEIETAKAFVEIWRAVNGAAPFPIIGISSGANTVSTFGDGPYPGPVPDGLAYLPLSIPPGAVFSDVIASCEFATNQFVIVNFAGSGSFPYYNGIPIATTEPIVAIPFERLQLVDCITFKNNVYVLSRHTLHRSATGNPALWKSTDPGAFSIDLAAAGMDTGGAVGLGVYGDLLVVYGRNQIQFWQMDPDPARCTLVRQLNGVGAFIRQSIAEYGDRDAFFAADAGIRSLRVRDSSGAATVNDVGAPIDEIIDPLIPSFSSFGSPWFHAAVEPKSGRYFVAMADGSIYVYSRSDNVSAWSEIKLGFAVQGFATARGRLYMKAGNIVYLYGGQDDDVYSTPMPVVQTPFFDMGKPATEKIVASIDAALEGEWRVEICSDVDRPDAWEMLGITSGTTYNRARFSLRAVGTHFALRFTGSGAPAARRRLSNVAVHYDLGEAG